MSEFYVVPEALRRFADDVAIHVQAAHQASRYAEEWLSDADADGELFSSFQRARSDAGRETATMLLATATVLDASGRELAESAAYYVMTDETEAAEHDAALPG